jgi:hypothetical protein
MITFQEPTRTLAILHSPRATEFVRDLWEQAGTYALPGTVQNDAELSVDSRWVGSEYLLTTIRLPPPHAAPEAWFVCLAATAPPGAETLADLTDIRVFTLEQSLGLNENVPGTMLCEWTPEGTHRNLGAGPPAELEAFYRSVVAQLSRD